MIHNTSDTSGQVKKANLSTKVSEIKNKIPNATGLATTTVLNTKKKRLKTKYLRLLI